MTSNYKSDCTVVSGMQQFTKVPIFNSNGQPVDFTQIFQVELNCLESNRPNRVGLISWLEPGVLNRIRAFEQPVYPRWTR